MCIISTIIHCDRSSVRSGPEFRYSICDIADWINEWPFAFAYRNDGWVGKYAGIE
ncbi:hypothetical protein CV_1868 [Chromobacterium violaceum ATCC 12472]|uniref:Uncharacterized protein n=1 Tax=Chromobacterium violaceum (strain ATCC 12472 / DSM 30191 / JCM 1249 / CCUG 213 / NBRC 12614 / NCIMB 9131 / NCTC 9757 / MK) TaxID=243365 RepID=Q7NWW1_CHRVO|nr:hypothetical protein CV_1868 [Chromobacterium violaceum ATCC 12472]